MLDLKVRIAWQGMVAIRDKYYEKAREEGLVIHHAGKKMTLTPDEVKSKIVMGSQPYADKFSSATHKLLYYAWNPDK
jgi:hypothetical protein